MVTILSMMAMKSMRSSLPEAAGEAATVLVVGCISPPCIMGRTPPTSRSTPVLFRWPEATDISLSLTYQGRTEVKAILKLFHYHFPKTKTKMRSSAQTNFFKPKLSVHKNHSR